MGYRFNFLCKASLILLISSLAQAEFKECNVQTLVHGQKIDLNLKMVKNNFVLSSSSDEWRAVSCDREDNRYANVIYDKSYTVIDGSKNSVKVRTCNGNVVPCLVRIKKTSTNGIQLGETISFPHSRCPSKFSTDISSQCTPVLAQSADVPFENEKCSVSMPGFNDKQTVTFGYDNKQLVGDLKGAKNERPGLYEKNSPHVMLAVNGTTCSTDYYHRTEIIKEDPTQRPMDNSVNREDRGHRGKSLRK